MVDFIEKSIEQITCIPEQFVSSENNLSTDLRKTLKYCYDFCKKEETSNNSDALPELIIENFDLEQIWQQLELQNESILKRNIGLVTKLVINKSSLVLNKEEEQNEVEDECDDNEQNSEDEEIQEDENDEEIQEEENDEEMTEEYAQNTFKKSVLDDNFFKLEEMNKFLLSEEKKISNNKKESVEDSESDESIDMFEGDSGEESDKDADTYNKKKNPRYKDFFGTKTQQTQSAIKENEEEMDYSDQDDENVNYRHYADLESNSKVDDNVSSAEEINNIKSALELREERLKMKIKELEYAAISEKPWQLKGEVLAENRPINSLLEEVLEYDVGSRPAPVITEATTMVLEDAIKQRIKDKSFDDVERKQKPVDTPLEYKKKLVLDQEKSKESLAQIYEKEYLQQAVQGNDEEKEEATPELHKDINSIMNSLFAKLDALSNFHFTPKPVAPELKIISNLPAINIEEVAPTTMTNASLLAPEEIKAKSKGDILGQNERTATDKNRERRKKKRKQKEHAKPRSKNVGIISKPGLGNKYAKEKVKKILDQVTKEKNVDKMDESYRSKGIKSSTAFFAQLQEEVTSQINSKMKDQKKKEKKMHDAKRLKL